jgi:hypothetical protein
LEVRLTGHFFAGDQCGGLLQMPFKEALFWVGLTVFGTGLYFSVEKGNVRLPYAIILLVVGLAAMVYPVVRHHYPDRKLPAIRGWVLLLIMTWAALGYDIYAEHMRPPTIVEKIIEKPVEKLGEKFKYPPDFQHLQQIDCDDPSYSGKKFINETVEVDGKEFLNCDFANVRLLFHGNQTFTIQHDVFDQSVVFATDNHAIAAYGEMLAVAGTLGTPDKGVSWGSDRTEFWVKRTFPLGTRQPIGVTTRPALR